MRAVELLVRWIDAVTTFVGEKISYLFIPMVVVALWEVLLRYVFNRPTIWAWDLNMQIQAALVSLAGAYVFLAGRFVVVDILVGHLATKARAIVTLITSVVGFFAVGMLTWLGAQGAWKAWQLNEHSSSNWAPPLYPIRFVVLAGFALLLFALVADFLRTFMVVMGKTDASAASTSQKGDS